MNVNPALKSIGILLKTFPKVSETFISNEIIALESAGFDLQIYSLNRPQERVFQSSTMTIKAPVTYIPAEDIANPVRIAVLHLLILMRRPIAYLKTLWFTWRRPEANRFREFVQAVSLTHILNRTGVIHLHTHYASEPAGVAEMVRKLRGTPFSISTHAKDIYLSPPETLRRKISHSRFVVTCTEHNRQYLSSIAAGDTPIARIYHGLVVDKFNPRSEDLYGQPGDRPPMILSVGRFRKKKGFPTLIQACRQLRDDGINFQCSIVGYGPEQESMEQLIEALRLGGRIHLLGKLVHEELTGLYRKADMFVLPCQIEENGDRDGIPNVIMEAMAMEVPVISTEASGIPELIDHRKTGILIPQKDPEALKSAMQELLGQPSLRRKIGMAGRQKILRSFNANQHIIFLKNLLADAIGEPPGAPVTIKEGVSANAN